MSDHRNVEKIFKKLLNTSEDDEDERAELFSEVDTLLSAHAKAEEKLFYPKTEANSKTRDLTLEAHEEHELVKLLLGQLRDMDPSEEVWGAKLTVLCELVKHHVKEEEEELFPKAQKIISKKESKELAHKIEVFEDAEIERKGAA